MILNINNSTLEIEALDTSYRYRSIMGDDTLTVHFTSVGYIDIPVGAYTDYQGTRYTLERPENFKKNSNRDFSYTINLESSGSRLKKYKLKNPIDKRLKFSYTAKPQEFIQLVVDNLNMRESGWSVGGYISDVEQVISFNHQYLNDALRTIAETFNTEYQIVGKVISLGKVEYNKESPLPLSYGKGAGFLPGVGRSNFDNSRVVEILNIQGGTQNIDKSVYGSSELLLPISQTLKYDGKYFEGEAGFDNSSAREYVSDELGLSIQRADKALSSYEEDSLDCSSIYPKRVGTITAVNVIDAATNLYDVIDSTIPEALDYDACTIAGEKMTIIFQSGMLATRPFDVKYIHADRRFEIVPTELDGITMPGGSYLPVTGDTYAIFGVQLPSAYISDNTTKAGASWDMFRRAVRYLYDNEVPRYTFKGELDGIYARKNWLSIGGKLVLGGYVLFSDIQFMPNGEKIRIMGIKDFINKPYKPTIELSNVSVSAGAGSAIKELPNDEQAIDNKIWDTLQYNRRRWRDLIETQKMLEKQMKNFSGSINPVSIRTMSIAVGDEFLQYQFVDSKTNPAVIADTFNWDDNTKLLTSGAGIIQHMTLGIDSLSPSHKPEEYHFWDIAAYSSPPLTDAAPYYVVLKCAVEGTTGEVYITPNDFNMNPGDGYYYFLLGTLGSEIDGIRSFVTLYGFTEILPGRITVYRIVAPDGKQYWDMLNGAFRIGDDNTYLYYKDGVLETQQLVIKSPGGSSAYAELFVGDYDPARQYYSGEYFDYTDGDQYICHKTPPAPGVLPTNTVYFRKKTVKGADGANGDWVSYVFKRSATQPATPIGTGSIPELWVDAPTQLGIWWMSKSTINGKTGLAGEWSVPIQVTGATGEPGAKGDKAIFKYAKNLSSTSAPSINASSLNPGVAWTFAPPSISSGEYIWMSYAIVNYDGTALVTNWTAPVRISGESGSNGLPGIVAVLTNGYHGIPTDASGNNGVYTNCTTTLNLYIGGFLQSSGVTYSFTPSDVSITTSIVGNKLDIISMGVDNAYVTCVATYNGISYSQIFKLNKIKAGAAGSPGAAGVSYWLGASAEIVVKKTVAGTTTYSPNILSFYPRKQIGTAVAVAAGAGCTLYVQGYRVSDSTWINLNSSPYVDPSLMTYSTPAISATYSQYRCHLYYGAVLLDEITVAMVEDAASAKDSIASLLGPFTNFGAYESYVQTYGSVLITGGKMRLNYIDTDLLVSKIALVTNFANLVGNTFDDKMVTVTTKNGMTFPAVINGVTTSITISPTTLPDLSSFLSSSSLTGTNSLAAFSSESWAPNGITYPDKVRMSSTYQSIPASVTSLKWNAINLAANFTVPSGGSGDINRRAGLKIYLYAKFYTDSTYVGQSYMGSVGGVSETDRIYYLSGSIPAGTVAVPVGVNRVYLYAQFACDVEYNSDVAPTCTLNFTALASSAYFINADGVYKSMMSPDGYALTRDATNYFHLKALTSKLMLKHRGDIESDSIQQVLLSTIVEANGTTRSVGGYGYRAENYTVSKRGTGVYQINHNMGSNLGMNSNMLNIQVTSEVGLVNWHLYPVSNNSFQIRTFTISGSPSDTVLHVNVTRIKSF